VKRPLFNLSAALSIVLAAALAMLWGRSQWYYDSLIWRWRSSAELGYANRNDIASRSLWRSPR